MSQIGSISPNGAISGPVPNVAASATAASSAANEGTVSARSILPSAVASTRTVLSYADTSRSGTPSSALAAQALDQDPDASEQHHAVFAPRGELIGYGAVSGEDARALASLRIQRGEIIPALAPVIAKVPITSKEPVATPQTTAPTTTQIATSTETNRVAEQTTLTETASQTPEARQQQATANAAPTTPAPKKTPITQARGAVAYQLAGTRLTPVVSSSIEAIFS